MNMYELCKFKQLLKNLRWSPCLRESKDWIFLWKAAYCEFVGCSVVFIQKHSSSVILLKFLTTKHGPEKQNTAINDSHHSHHHHQPNQKCKGYPHTSWPHDQEIHNELIWKAWLWNTIFIIFFLYVWRNVAVDDRQGLPFHDDYNIPIWSLFTGKPMITVPGDIRDSCFLDSLLYTSISVTVYIYSWHTIKNHHKFAIERVSLFRSSAGVYRRTYQYVYMWNFDFSIYNTCT